MLAKWRYVIGKLRGPPSSFQQLRELTERMHAGADLQLPDPYAPPQLPPAPTARRGRSQTHEWSRIGQIDDANRRTFFAANNRAPTWKERREMLRRELRSKTPHIETLKKKLRAS
jgi:hypothetical protein